VKHGARAHDGALEAVRPVRTVLSGLSSDAHTWNLVYLELLLTELGCQVTNLGACTPDETIVAECVTRRPDLIVISSLNGHGCRDGVRLITAIRGCQALLTTPAVIGGKLDTGGGDEAVAAQLLAMGFDAVFGDTTQLTSFRSFVLAVGGNLPLSVS
jgi:methylaspartate mutase sigma subunit